MIIREGLRVRTSAAWTPIAIHREGGDWLASFESSPGVVLMGRGASGEAALADLLVVIDRELEILRRAAR